MNTKTINSKKDFKFNNTFIKGTLSIEDIKNMSIEVKTQLIYECLYYQFLEMVEDSKKKNK
jgi:hypothetical protein